MAEADGIKFVKGALMEAIKWDGSSGGVIRMVVLKKDSPPQRHIFFPDENYVDHGAKA